MGVPIPCQIPYCPKTFRDDKLKVYPNHQTSEHYNYEQNGLTEVHLKSYFCGTHMLVLLRIILFFVGYLVMSYILPRYYKPFS